MAVGTQPRFYYDFCSPEAYLAAERVMQTTGLVRGLDRLLFES